MTERCFGLDFSASSKLKWEGMSSAISTKASDSMRSISCGGTGGMAAPIDTADDWRGLVYMAKVKTSGFL